MDRVLARGRRVDGHCQSGKGRQVCPTISVYAGAAPVAACGRNSCNLLKKIAAPQNISYVARRSFGIMDNYLDIFSVCIIFHAFHALHQRLGLARGLGPRGCCRSGGLRQPLPRGDEQDGARNAVALKTQENKADLAFTRHCGEKGRRIIIILVILVTNAAGIHEQCDVGQRDDEPETY